MGGTRQVQANRLPHGGQDAPVPAGSGSSRRNLPLAQSEFEFLAPPSISVQTYQAVYCQPRHGMVSDACPYAPQMYQMLVDAGIDPVIELAFAAKETEFGVTGPGRSPQHNIHCVICNGADGSTCQGPYHTRFATYSSYMHSIEAWINLMLTQGIYIDAGRTSFREVIPVYAPSFENNTSLYIAQTESWVRGWRAWDREQGYVIQPATPEVEVWGAGIRQPPAELGDPRYLNGTRVPGAQTIALATPPDNLDTPPLPAETAHIVDDTQSGFSSNQDTWAPGWCGVNEKHRVTNSTSDLQASSSRASWVPTVLTPGVYEVQAYIPGCGHGDASQSVRYTITHDEGVSTVQVNQQAHSGQWVSLGVYPFGARFMPTVEINNFTEDNSLDVLADAVAWIPSSKEPTLETSRAYGGVPMPPGQSLREDERVPLPQATQRTHRQTGWLVALMPAELRWWLGHRVWYRAGFALPLLEMREPDEQEVAQPQPTATAQPTRTLVTAGVHVVVRGGYLRNQPRMSGESVVARVCPGDEVDVLQQQPQGGYDWLYIRVLAVAGDCSSDRAAPATEGWISPALVAR
jgi:hypothetical protein